ncbi:abortive infection family protein [Agrobacterium rhizogenes]|nr:abortive infection family protein [Rhizobium rhizogenes]NTJ82203.1 abortive infection family protein [Rhizobium rhizogenes]
MSGAFSSFVIEALVQTISGGHGLTDDEPIGLYRTANQIDGFLLACGIDSSRFDGSRLPKLRSALLAAAEGDNGFDLIRRCIESVTDPRGFLGKPDKATAVLESINHSLQGDGFEVVVSGGKAKLQKVGTSGPAMLALSEKTMTLDFDTVSHEIERALKGVQDDPEDSVTAACSLIEAVCRSILIELGLELPAKKDVDGLVRAVQEPLNLSPGRGDLPEEVAADIRQVLGGLTSVAKGVGALRTHAGDAHGRERGRTRIDARIARLSINAASTLALFLIETWEKTQRRTLPKRDAA